MSFTYDNFRGDTYYLHSKKTKKGNTTYHFSKKVDGAVDIEEVPNGYEIYEEPNGKVYLRKELKQLIDVNEMNLIEKGIKNYSDIKDFKLDVKKNVVYIYIVDNSFLDMPIPADQLDKYKNYDTNLRFILVDKGERRFEVERFCYLGDIDEWIFLDASTDLEDLVREYSQHLGKESFYELM